jgi:glycosyltransferase involved in cell wall biosynthesis
MVAMNNFLHDIRVRKEAQALASAGHDVLVLAMKKPEARAEEQIAGFAVRRIALTTRPWPKRVSFQMVKYLEFSARVTRQITMFDPDVVHAHDFTALPVGWIASRLVGARLVYDSHEYWLGRDNPLYTSRIGRYVVKTVEGLIARRADSVITINRSIAEALAAQYGISLPTIVMNAQPLTTFQETDKLRPMLGVSSDTHIVIYAGSLRPHRGLEQLVQGMRYLSHDVVLVLMGPDRMDGRLQDYVDGMDLTSRVRIIPPVPEEDVASYVSAADVGVVASQSTCLNRYYGLGNKIFHYVAAGIPIAVSDQPERRRLAETYGIGLVFDETDPRDIARKIEELLSNAELRREMRGRARRAHSAELNWEAQEAKLLKLYERFL